MSWDISLFPNPRTLRRPQIQNSELWESSTAQHSPPPGPKKAFLKEEDYGCYAKVFFIFNAVLASLGIILIRMICDKPYRCIGSGLVSQHRFRPLSRIVYGVFCIDLGFRGLLPIDSLGSQKLLHVLLEWLADLFLLF